MPEYFGMTPGDAQLERIASATEEAAAASARESANAAKAAKRSAFWTMVAGIAAAVGVLLNTALSLGWLDGLKREVKPVVLSNTQVKAIASSIPTSIPGQKMPSAASTASAARN
ncbi:hypothetical protein [Pandoraea eparura]|uniref:hypothetical protein n=1 Tax=Pandoraea eparura TaxID=2508291 RepID=UPI00123F26E8|nr:hypothetical protein [Pandoraea eparura]